MFFLAGNGTCAERFCRCLHEFAPFGWLYEGTPTSLVSKGKLRGPLSKQCLHIFSWKLC